MARCVLFILSTRGYGYGGQYGDGYECGGCGACANCGGNQGYNEGMPWANNSGLFNSCAFVVDMLNASGVAARLVQIDDPSEIAHKIIACGPTDVVIEALFVSPEVLAALAVQFPRVRWIVRTHSELPFLVNESRAAEWLFGYFNVPSVSVGANTASAVVDLTEIARSYFPHWDAPTLAHRIPLLPNYYPMPAALPRIPSPFGVLNVGCLGAIRPLKNQLVQAVAALSAARALGRRLRFHVNATRVEGQGRSPSILANLRALFAHAVNAELVPHPWIPRSEFLALCRQMDVGMQVSFSETFNIVSADFVTNDVPVVVSPEISWVDPRAQASPTDTPAITKAILSALSTPDIVAASRAGLIRYNVAGRQDWLDIFGETANGWTDRPASFVARPAIVARATHL